MSKRMVVASVLSVMLALPAATLAGTPARPRPLSPAQHRHLAQIERQSEHTAVRDVQATYTNNRAFDRSFTRGSDAFWTIAYLGGAPAAIIAVLICAAPL